MNGDEIYDCFRWKRPSFSNNSAAAHRGRIFTGPLSLYLDRPLPTMEQFQSQGVASGDPVTAKLRKTPFFFRLKKSGPEDPVLLPLALQSPGIDMPVEQPFASFGVQALRGGGKEGIRQAF